MSYIGTNLVYNKPLFRFHARKMAGRGLGKNLFSDFDEDSDSPSDDAIRVFLRLKPTNNDNGVIEVLDSKTLLFKMPSELTHVRKKLNMPDQYKYAFTKIFETSVTQAEIFIGSVANHVKDLFSGGHCLLFTYGTTNAGKTFTVLGNGNDPGIIPRTLTTVFKSIKGKEYRSSKITPCMFNSALELTDRTVEEELVFKQKILTWNPDKTQYELSRIGKSHISGQSSVDEIIGESVFKEMRKRLTNDTSIISYDAEPEDRFSVWVSFAEIYNEAIFDLLQPVALNCKRKPLKLAQDNHKNTYIKGLKHVHVETEEEAYKVLMFGKNNLQVAATGMNSRSSRSHCIFTIKLIKCLNVEQPERVTVSSFSICDLAGAERQKKALNVGLRLKESQNINCSLHVLSRCFSIIRENQLNNEHKLIPFRDSKLTQLFQHALLGKESVTMIVNVNSDQHLCEETQHVLKASAIAKHIVVQPRPINRPPRDKRTSIFSQVISRHNRSTLIRWDSCVKPKAPDTQSLDLVSVTTSDTQEPSEKEKKQEQYENLLVLVESLKDKVKEEKNKLIEAKKNWKNRECEIRSEMRAEVDQMLTQAKLQNELDLKKVREVEVTDNRKERFISGSQERIPAKKPKRTFDTKEDDFFLSGDIKELQDEIKMQQKQIDGLTDLANILRDEKKELTMELSSAKLQTGWKEKEIQELKNKIEMFGEESEVKAAYLGLQKEMETKLRGRDYLLEEARDDLLAEIRGREDAEDELARIEKELAEKVEKNLLLETEVEDLKQEVENKTNSIETLEMNFDEEIKCIERRCNKLEEELAEKTDYITDLQLLLNQSKEENRKKELEVDLLKSEVETLKTSKENCDEHYKHLEDQCIKLKEDYKQLEDQCIKLKEELKKKDDEIQNLTLLMEKIKEECPVKDFEKQIIELKNVVNNLTYEKNTLQEELRTQCNKLYLLKEEKEKTDDDHCSEVSILDQSLKQQIQESIMLTDKLNEKEKKLIKAKGTIEKLQEALKSKEHDLECSLNKIMGFESSVPTLKAELDMQRAKSCERDKMYDDLKATIYNMEQEKDSFQVNQREIIGKYEDQLRKTKEENENLKKEVARVTNTFYKTTPTPKKELEKQIEALKKQLEESHISYHKLKEEKEAPHPKIFLIPDESEKENLVIYDTNYSSFKGNQRSRTMGARMQASSEEDGTSDSTSQTDIKKCKSGSKVKTRKTKASVIPPLDVTGNENVAKQSERTPKPRRKKLWDQSLQDNTSHFDIQVDAAVLQDSPGTIVKRSLRTRNKDGYCLNSTHKSLANSGQCVGCYGKGLLNKVLEY